MASRCIMSMPTSTSGRMWPRHLPLRWAPADVKQPLLPPSACRRHFGVSERSDCHLLTIHVSSCSPACFYMLAAVCSTRHGVSVAQCLKLQVCMIAPKGLNCGCENYTAPAGDVTASTDTSVVGIVANQSALTAAVASPASLTGAAQDATGGAKGLQRAHCQA